MLEINCTENFKAVVLPFQLNWSMCFWGKIVEYLPYVYTPQQSSYSTYARKQQTWPYAVLV